MMLKWIKKYWPGGTFVLAGAVIGFFAGQYVPAYIDYANEQRGEVAELINQVSTKGDEFERTIKPLMLIAGDAVPPTAEPRRSLDDKMFELFQTLETVKMRLPESEPQRQAYVLALRDLKEAAAGVTGSLTGKELIEAASAFKKARTDYEARLEQLEPSFLTAVLTNIL